MKHELDILTGGFGSLQGSHSPGIERYVLGVDEDAVTVEHRELLSDVPSPAWLERDDNRDGDMLYAALENSNELAALRIERPQSDRVALTLVSRVPVPGVHPTHVAVTADDSGHRHAIVADYVDGTVVVFPVFADGSLGPAAQVLHGEGHGPLPAQEGPHAHWVLPLPDGRVLTTDLGADRIHVHRWHDGELTRVGAVTLAPGTGPRDMHVLPSHDGSLRIAVVDEWGDTVTVLGCDTNGGEPADLQVLQTVDLGGDDDPRDQAASLAYAPDVVIAGNDGASAYPGFAYVGLRGSERIVTLRWDGDRLQRLAPIDAPGWQGRGIFSGGSRPRHLRLIGRYLIAANEVSDDLSVFRIAPNGEPIPCGNVPVGSPAVILPL
ncbi:lactonase family protein [Bifidobacterium avesanii]|uniref:Beta-propeller fold lactonase family protein n=1 Tax=Bifidobacterium avesanii TaxID=1798157 RepID=A0A7K3TFG2_9BIFI|nr:beta-propeller fold lactonase family protein [Bifidobacterium avesanii]KAB8294331.1 carboxy-cis,cis-muconate cyclase [Bifidobacterium avesanii]NEG77835.1 beta-propeller fold lactonase family protein [Bifidobacterium avesanii]